MGSTGFPAPDAGQDSGPGCAGAAAAVAAVWVGLVAVGAWVYARVHDPRWRS